MIILKNYILFLSYLTGLLVVKNLNALLNPMIQYIVNRIMFCVQRAAIYHCKIYKYININYDNWMWSSKYFQTLLLCHLWKMTCPAKLQLILNPFTHFNQLHLFLQLKWVLTKKFFRNSPIPLNSSTDFNSSACQIRLESLKTAQNCFPAPGWARTG